MKAPIKKLNTCSFCVDEYGNAKTGFIFPEDMLARREHDGKWKCGICITEEIRDRIVRISPNSQRARELKAQDKRDVDKHNQVADRLHLKRRAYKYK